MMKKFFIRLVDVKDLLITGLVGWIIKEVLDYAKQTIRTRFRVKGKSHLSCLWATVILVAIDRLLRVLRWQEWVLVLIRPIVGKGVYTLVASDEIPIFTLDLLSRSRIFDFFMFEIIL